MTPNPSPSSTSLHAASSGPESVEVDGIALLMADHDDVKEMFIEYDELVRGVGQDAERIDLLEQICLTLAVHASLEEEIFYPAARDALGDPGPIDKAEQEHGAVDALIEQLHGMDPSDASFDDTVQRLRDTVDQHVQEEESELFVRLRDSSMDVLSLGLEMADRRDELLSQFEEEGREE